MTKKDDEIAAENDEKAKREVALQKMIDKQIEEDEKGAKEEVEDYSIIENPMNAVLNK